MFCFSSGQPEAAKRLVDAGADITARVRGTNETALDLAHAADLSQDVMEGEKFRDQLILWETAYKALRAEEARNAKPPQVGRHPSSESITSAPSSSSPLLKRSSPRLPRYIQTVFRFMKLTKQSTRFVVRMKNGYCSRLIDWLFSRVTD